MTGFHLAADTVERIRVLRYEDGMSSPEVGRLLGVNEKTVRRIAPGMPGKVPNAPAREVFLASGLPARRVALELGWLSPQHYRNGEAKLDGDSSRLLRTLGLRPEWGRYRKNHRQMIDAEVAMNIAEACGVAGWSVLPDEDSVAA